MGFQIDRCTLDPDQETTAYATLKINESVSLA
jgi:hypothetical protein